MAGACAVGQAPAIIRHMTPVPPVRHLLRARDLIDARYREPLDVPAMARAARLSTAHFSREFRRAFGEPPHQYLLTRRLERATALLRGTEWSVAEVCLNVGLQSVGSFTTAFRRTYGMTPTAYRAAYPPAASRAMIPSCVVRAWGRPSSAMARGPVAEPLSSPAAEAYRGEVVEHQRQGTDA